MQTFSSYTFPPGFVKAESNTTGEAEGEFMLREKYELWLITFSIQNQTTKAAVRLWSFRWQFIKTWVTFHNKYDLNGQTFKKEVSTTKKQISFFIPSHITHSKGISRGDLGCFDGHAENVVRVKVHIRLVLKSDRHFLTSKWEQYFRRIEYYKAKIPVQLKRQYHWYAGEACKSCAHKVERQMFGWIYFFVIEYNAINQKQKKSERNTREKMTIRRTVCEGGLLGSNFSHLFSMCLMSS